MTYYRMTYYKSFISNALLYNYILIFLCKLMLVTNKNESVPLNVYTIYYISNLSL